MKYIRKTAATPIPTQTMAATLRGRSELES
jgi:hypothetical protein